MTTGKNKPVICPDCGEEGVFHQYTTFSYWYCRSCKEEIDPTPPSPPADDKKPWWDFKSKFTPAPAGLWNGAGHFCWDPADDTEESDIVLFDPDSAVPPDDGTFFFECSLSITKAPKS